MMKPQQHTLPGGFGMQGYFCFYAKDQRGEVRKLAEFKNLILDAGLERLGTSHISPIYVQVGSGTTVPTNTQTSLTTYVGGTALTSSTPAAYVAGPPAFIRRTYRYEFAKGAVTGNLAEVGVGWGASGAQLISRALILDNQGVPTTLSILPTESLIVTYELRQYPNINDSVDSFDIGGVSTQVRIRPARISNTGIWSFYVMDQGFANPYGTDYSGGIGDVFSTPSGVAEGGVSTILLGYSANSKARDIQLTWGPSAGMMAGGVGSVLFGVSGMEFQAQFTPKLTKTNTQTRVITFRLPWARA